MKKTLSWIVLVVVVVLAVVWAGKSKVDDVKIGFIGPLTGDASALGSSARAAVELAIEEFNAAGGYNGKPVLGVYEDGKCTGAVANSAAQKLINIDKVNTIVGGLCSGETLSFLKLATEKKVPTMSYGSSVPTLSGASPYFVRDYPSDAKQGAFAASDLYTTLGARKVAVLYHVSDWGTGIKDVFVSEFKKMGGEIILEDGSATTNKDYKTAVAKVKELKPDYIFMPMYPEGATVAIKQLQDQGVKTKIFGTDTFTDPKFLTDVAKAADILYGGVKLNINETFVQKINAKTGGTQVPIGTAEAYDAANIFLAAIKKVGTDPDKIMAEVHTSDTNGVSGRIRFDDKGDRVDTEYLVTRIKNGALVEVK